MSIIIIVFQGRKSLLCNEYDITIIIAYNRGDAIHILSPPSTLLIL